MEKKATLFRRNAEGERRVWVDRGIDARLDNFAVCEPCDDRLRQSDPASRAWHGFPELYGDCRANFQAHALAADLFGYFVLDQEPEGWPGV